MAATIPKDTSPKILQWQWLSFAVIAFLTIMAYSPSLLHVPRSDQIAYLAETAQTDSWAGLAVRSYDFNRTRHYDPGDELLFRPVYYFILGNERFFFRYHFMLWQGFGLFLHLLVIWWLLRILLAVRVGIWASLTAGFFALMYMNMEMVVWHHISSYMFFVLLIEGALYHAIMYAEKGGRRSWRLVPVFFLLLAASFTYEIGSIYAFLFACYFWLKDRKNTGITLALLSIPLLYFAANFADLALHHVSLEHGRQIARRMEFFPMMKNIFLTASWWIYSGLFFPQHELSFGARNLVPFKDKYLYAPLKLFHPVVSGALAVSVAYVFVAAAGIKKGLARERRSWLLLVGAMLLTYVMLVAVARVPLKGLRNILGVNIYYNYFFWIWAVVLGYGLLNFEWIESWKRGRIFRVVVAGGLAFLIAANGLKLYEANAIQADSNRPLLVLLRTLDLLIKEHGQEPDFSFYVSPGFMGNYERQITKRDRPGEKFTESFVSLLYPQYFRETGAKYRFVAGSFPPSSAGK